MCLAIPARILEILPDSPGNLGTQGKVSLEGVVQTISLELLESPQVGDYVIVHVGFALKKLDEAEALETLELMRQVLTMTAAPLPEGDVA